ncbi:hypothetical protein Tco_1220729 [Tanacetum coccineum]
MDSSQESFHECAGHELLCSEAIAVSSSKSTTWGRLDVILGIRIKHESNGIAISQSHYIEKVLKKFNYFDCTPVSTLMDTSILVTLCWKVTLDCKLDCNTEDIRLMVGIPAWDNPISLLRKILAEFNVESWKDRGTEARYLQIIPRMCLELLKRWMEVFTFSWSNFLKKALAGAMNKVNTIYRM